MSVHGSTTEEVLFYPFVGATILAFILALLSGEMWEGVVFLITRGSMYNYFSYFSVGCFFLFHS